MEIAPSQGHQDLSWTGWPSQSSRSVSWETSCKSSCTTLGTTPACSRLIKISYLLSIGECSGQKPSPVNILCIECYHHTHDHLLFMGRSRLCGSYTFEQTFPCLPIIHILVVHFVVQYFYYYIH